MSQRFTVTLPGLFVDYMRGTEAWDSDLSGTEGPGSRELGKALRTADRRKVGRGYSVTVTLSERALDVARDYALDMGETAGVDYEPSWPRAARTVIDRIDTALEAVRAARGARAGERVWVTAELEARRRIELEAIRAAAIAAEVRAAVGETLGMSAGLRRPR